MSAWLKTLLQASQMIMPIFWINSVLHIYCSVFNTCSFNIELKLNIYSITQKNIRISPPKKFVTSLSISRLEVPGGWYFVGQYFVFHVVHICGVFVCSRLIFSAKEFNLVVHICDFPTSVIIGWKWSWGVCLGMDFSV